MNHRHGQANWIEDFSPKMVVFIYPCAEDKDQRVVQAVCADRVFRVRYQVALRKGGVL